MTQFAFTLTLGFFILGIIFWHIKIKQMKQEVLVKLAGSTVYNKRINIDPNNLTNILKFPKEVFADIDGIRIAILRDDYEQLIKNIK